MLLNFHWGGGVSWGGGGEGGGAYEGDVGFVTEELDGHRGLGIRRVRDGHGKERDSKREVVVGALVRRRRQRGRLAGGEDAGVRVVVVDRREREGLAAGRAGQARAHPDGRGRRRRRGDQDVGALPDGQRHGRGGVRVDRREVGGDDRHGVVVDRELLDPVRARVDEPQPVGFALLELELGETGVGGAGRGVAGGDGGAVKVVLAVDEVVVRGHARVAVRGEHLRDDVVVVAVVPVWRACQRKGDWFWGWFLPLSMMGPTSMSYCAWVGPWTTMGPVTPSAYWAE